MKSLLIVAGLLVFLSCNAFENENPELLELQGTWELKRSIGGIGGWATDYDTVDYTISFEVIREKANWIVNDKVERSYNIGRSTESDYLLKFNPIENNRDDYKLPRYLLRIEGDEMEIVDSCYDCFNYYFSRSED